MYDEPREPGSDAVDRTAGSASPEQPAESPRQPGEPPRERDGRERDGPPRKLDEPPRVTFRGRRNPRRVYIGWPVLAAIGALVGFLTGGLPGLFVGGVLGYLVWRLR